MKRSFKKEGRECQKMFNYQGKNKQRFGLSFSKVTKFNENGPWQKKLQGKLKKCLKNTQS